MTNCRNCNHTIQEKFCGNCGQPVQLTRVDGRYILHEIQHVLHLEKGIFYTVKELLLRPGQSVRTFIADNRNRLVKPVLFIVLASLVYTLINKLFHIEEAHAPLSALQQSMVSVFLHWIQNHYGYSSILMGVFIAMWLKLFHRSDTYNFFEILILLCFVMGMSMLLSAVFALVEGLTHLNLFFVSGFAGLAYCTWATGQFFHKRSISSYLKAFVSYILGMLLFYILVIFLGIMFDLLLHRVGGMH